MEIDKMKRYRDPAEVTHVVNVKSTTELARLLELNRQQGIGISAGPMNKMMTRMGEENDREQLSLTTIAIQADEFVKDHNLTGLFPAVSYNEKQVTMRREIDPGVYVDYVIDWK